MEANAELLPRYPECGGTFYVALRAPDNTWNGFYTAYAYPLVANLIRQFLLFGDVDPNKVFLMGYSHGGYGAFAIGPKMPDRFAAIHASAAALADGAVPDTLRNTVFVCMVGEKDTAYGRIKRDTQLAAEIQRLRGDRTDIFPVTVQVIADHPHSGCRSRHHPGIVSHRPEPGATGAHLGNDGPGHSDFFWLRVPAAQRREILYVHCRDNTVTVDAAPNVASASILLDERLLDFAKPVKLTLNGRTTTSRLRPKPPDIMRNDAASR